jgi:hypothetical protein
MRRIRVSGGLRRRTAFGVVATAAIAAMATQVSVAAGVSLPPT